MQEQVDYSSALFAARCIADQAVVEGVLETAWPTRPTYHHMGAVLADAVLQAGLNYSAIVLPRVRTILEVYPHATTVSSIARVVETEGSSAFLKWRHQEKISRFDNLLEFLSNNCIEDTSELSREMLDDDFRAKIQEIRGIGPKTVDYMACLVGVDCIAVDRHIRGFAELAGITNYSYEYLRDVFNFAADFLNVSRREFDASIWNFQVSKSSRQMTLNFDFSNDHRN